MQRASPTTSTNALLFAHHQNPFKNPFISMRPYIQPHVSNAEPQGKAICLRENFQNQVH